VHDGRITVDGVGSYIDQSIDRALRSLDNPSVPARVREKLRERLEKLRGKLRGQLNHLDARDVEQLGEEMGRIGEQIGSEMERFGDDMDRWGRDFGKQMSHDVTRDMARWGQRTGHGGVDNGDVDDDDTSGTDVVDDDDVDDAARGLGTLSLRRGQREQIAQLRAASEQQVAAAKQALATAEGQLHELLDNPAASDADIARAIDAVSQQEAAIRKARILAWHSARRVLDDGQRRQVEDAVRGHGR
jgi:hypothetical protein